MWRFIYRGLYSCPCLLLKYMFTDITLCTRFPQYRRILQSVGVASLPNLPPFSFSLLLFWPHGGVTIKCLRSPKDRFCRYSSLDMFNLVCDFHLRCRSNLNNNIFQADDEYFQAIYSDPNSRGWKKKNKSLMIFFILYFCAGMFSCAIYWTLKWWARQLSRTIALWQRGWKSVVTERVNRKQNYFYL